VGQLSEDVFGSRWLGVFTAVFTFFFIILAEIIPKTIGERFSEPIALATAPWLLFATRAILPLIWLIEMLTAPFSGSRGAHVASEDEIRVLASVSHQAGTISRHESEIIRRAFHLNDVTARDVMTHRLKVSFLPAEKPLSEIRPQEIQDSHSRIPVAADGDLDKVVGVVYLKDLLLALAQGRTDATVGALKQPVQFVYEATPAHRLLREFQRTHQHLFVVVDEYGGTSGVVSLEDVLEELVGEIEDEMDAREKAQARPAADGRELVNANQATSPRPAAPEPDKETRAISS
jgi:CBS domain containing-hemolysin-like protein